MATTRTRSRNRSLGALGPRRVPAGWRLRVMAAALGLLAVTGPARANPGSGMAGDHPRDYLHEDLDTLQEAHQLVVCGVRDQGWFDSQLTYFAKRAFAHSMARAHGEHPALTDVAFAIHGVVAEAVSVRTTLEDCHNLGSGHLGDEGYERMREIRESINLIQSGSIFLASAPVAVAAAAPLAGAPVAPLAGMPVAPAATACVLRPVVVARRTAPRHASGPVAHARRQTRVVMMPC